MPRTGRPRKDAQLETYIPPRNRAKTPELREQQLISAAYDLAERQIHEGTASAQVITTFLKLGTTREKLEQARIAGEVEIQKAKMEQMASSARIEELYLGAMNAMRSYQGEPPIELEGEVLDDQFE